MANAPKKSDNKSGVTHKEYATSVLGGYPEKKSVEQIDKANMPRSRGRAPGSVSR